ncbi:hypothetical protein EBB79_11520 [Parasedimentitalea marina]|uniref:Uncharacterized protein n=1 Tax=Parasedimentitalea marina TaxID=2483033 RepID=A0A3T0N382_9RHOB|nr:hypothetical protein EBB79_11520 [Parasedimentitalea marina]
MNPDANKRKTIVNSPTTNAAITIKLRFIRAAAPQLFCQRWHGFGQEGRGHLMTSFSHKKKYNAERPSAKAGRKSLAQSNIAIGTTLKPKAILLALRSVHADTIKSPVRTISRN